MLARKRLSRHTYLAPLDKCSNSLTITSELSSQCQLVSSVHQRSIQGQSVVTPTPTQKQPLPALGQRDQPVMLGQRGQPATPAPSRQPAIPAQRLTLKCR